MGKGKRTTLTGLGGGVEGRDGRGSWGWRQQTAGCAHVHQSPKYKLKKKMFIHQVKTNKLSSHLILKLIGRVNIVVFVYTFKFYLI